MRLPLWFCFAATVLPGCAGSERGALAVNETASADPEPERWAAMRAEIRRSMPSVEHLDTAAVQRALRSPEPPVLVDTRAASEYAVSHIPGAIHIAYDAPVEEWRRRLPAGRPVIVYCSVGYRSGLSAARLGGALDVPVRNYIGSIFAWANRGLAVVDREGAATDRVHPYDAHWGALLRADRRAAR